MRQYLRHPTDIPLRYNLTGQRAEKREALRDIGRGGLCFRAHDPIQPGTVLHLAIPLQGPPFEAHATVVWCSRVQGGHDIGVRFEDHETEYVVRIVEQACHIEHYKRTVLKKEGRRLSGEEAATEWIERHAADFPR